MCIPTDDPSMASHLYNQRNKYGGQFENLNYNCNSERLSTLKRTGLLRQIQNLHRRLAQV